MELLEGYKDPDLYAMSQGQLVGLVHGIINLINSDRVLSEAVFHYTPAEMDKFIDLIQIALAARQASKPDMVELVEVLYGDPVLRELKESSTNVTSQRIHKRARYGGRRTARGYRKNSRRR